VFVAEMTPAVMARIPATVDGWPVVVRESGQFRGLGD